MGPFGKLSRTQIDGLQYYVNQEHPFGPENAKNVKEKDLHFLLFNENNILCQEYKKNPRIIIGRRGSGKTTITANTEYIDKHSYILRIHPEEIINTIQSISYPDGSFEEQYIESIAKVWKITLNTMLMAHIANGAKTTDIMRIRGYLATCDIPVDGTLTSVMGALRKRSENLNEGVASFLLNIFLDSLNSGTATYQDAMLELESHLKDNRFDAVIIIDSLEDYLLIDSRKQRIMSGLLKCVGEFGDRVRHIRLCIPGELYFDVLQCSSNPLKDFTRNLLLHWLPLEIFGIIAWRYMLYSRMYDPDNYERLCEYNIKSRDGVLKIIRDFLPENVVNGLGIKEPTLPYIIRHTQLLPRQVILILNQIFGRASSKDIDIRNIPENQIVRAITNVESTLCGEVFTAYKDKYPLGYKACEACIPEIPRIFDDGLLHKAFNRHAKSVYKSEESDFEYRDFKKMLIEMGVVGRVRSSTEIYAEAEFEYAQPGRLSVSVEDKLCLHPIFSGEFSSVKNNGSDLLVYPQKDWFERDRGRHLRVNSGQR